VPQGHEIHCRTDFYALSNSRNAGQHRHDIHDGAMHDDVVPGPDSIESQPLDASDIVHQRSNGWNPLWETPGQAHPNHLE
jgi:hypothetical protein